MVVDYRDIWQINFLLSNGTQAIENDSQGRPLYIGYAGAGTDKAASGWQIRKLTYDGNGAVTDVQFANGTATFDKIWNNRGTYSYS